MVTCQPQGGIESKNLVGKNARDSRKIPVQRRNEILKFVRGRGAASVSEIADTLVVSESTVRRDLTILAEEGAITRSYGGAVTLERTTFEPLFKDRLRHNRDQKERIGRYAASLLDPGQSVVFDSSSTVLSAAEALEQRLVPITAVTNDVSVACALADIPEVEVIVPGGEMRAGSFTLLGSYTQDFLTKLHVDIAFLGIHAIADGVLTDTSLAVSEAKRAMMAAARRTVLLADHSKFGPTAFFEVARLDAVDDLVTDTETPEEVLAAIRDEEAIRMHVV